MRTAQLGMLLGLGGVAWAAISTAVKLLSRRVDGCFMMSMDLKSEMSGIRRAMYNGNGPPIYTTNSILLTPTHLTTHKRDLTVSPRMQHRRH